MVTGIAGSLLVLLFELEAAVAVVDKKLVFETGDRMTDAARLCRAAHKLSSVGVLVAALTCIQYFIRKLEPCKIEKVGSLFDRPCTLKPLGHKLCKPIGIRFVTGVAGDRRMGACQRITALLVISLGVERWKKSLLVVALLTGDSSIRRLCNLAKVRVNVAVIAVGKWNAFGLDSLSPRL